MSKPGIAPATVLTVAVVALLSVSLFAGDALAQSKDQEKCINSINKAGGKVAATQGKENSKCIKDAGAGKIGDADACMAADGKQKVAKAQAKVTSTASDKCSGAANPPFGFTNASTINTSAVDEERALASDVLGAIVQNGILTDKAGAKCQAAVVKAYEKYASTRVKTFLGCKKGGLKTDGVNSSATLQSQCMFASDAKSLGKVGKAEAKIQKALDKKCVGVSTASAFPGECAAAVDVSACLAAAADCRTCLYLNAADGIDAGCDDLDNGALDQTCRQCGNSLTEAPEECDGGGESASCDPDCTNAICGDGFTNVTAGEQCDDADADNSDTCTNTCDDAVCGDGFTCTDPACATGPTGGIEECDDAGSNSDVTPDACRADCALPSCGDGVTDTGEDCDDAGESATCDADCTFAVCPDGTVNGAAGEQCDDDNGSDTDPCPTTCLDAICGDNFTCSEAGCTSGPGGGTEECDDAGSNSDVTPDACRTSCALPSCGDGVTDTGEDCDDAGESATCNSDCTTAVCGDGKTNATAGEDCDDAGESATCDADCTTAVCGDGNINGTAGEICDDAGESATCDTDCTPAMCGDGTTNATAGEACDDAGESATCDADCTTAVCGDGTTNVLAGEECDDGAGNSDVLPDSCRNSCLLASCGDGVIDSGETCDDAGESATCDTDCTPPACGDGTTNATAGEACDDAGESATCDADCTDAECGDGFTNVTAGEECDDGNMVGGDGCSSVCTCGMGSGEVGCQDARCPGSGEIVLFAGVRAASCTTNADCFVDGALVGTCDTGLGQCVTVSVLDTGWTGIALGQDINDQVSTRGDLLCPGPFDGGSSEPCGECEVLGLDAVNTDLCRCANDNSIVCANKFEFDATSCSLSGVTCSVDDDCKVCDQTTSQSCLQDTDCPGSEVCLGGPRQPSCIANQCVATCDCYFGPPLPLSAGNVPACAVNKFANDVSGTANVDLGEGEITANLLALVYLGELITVPCPYCTGDTTLHDGVRDGTCVFGEDAGKPCDAQAPNLTFPSPTGDGHSLDCFPTLGKNVSGAGLKINLVQTTGTQTLTSGVECGFSFTVPPELCPCGICSGDPTTTCTNNTDCSSQGLGTCGKVGQGNPRQNTCDGGDVCIDTGGNRGECSSGPIGKFCDGVFRANGDPFVACLSDADCDNTDCGSGSGPGLCGTCSLSRVRGCMLPTIVATGVADPDTPIGAAAFCIPATASAGINSAVGLPGPARAVNQTRARTFCFSDPGTEYIPGTGGCP